MLFPKPAPPNQPPLSPARRVAGSALLAAILALLGCFKLPGLIPGTEFQLSAPFAVCLAACLGFGAYFKIGIAASLINLMLGTHTLINICVALVFRLAAGSVITLAGPKPPALLIAGPLGTAAGRLVLAPLLGVPVLPLLAAAVPGMVYTAIGSLLLYPVLRRSLGRLYSAAPISKEEVIPHDSKTPAI